MSRQPRTGIPAVNQIPMRLFPDLPTAHAVVIMKTICRKPLTFDVPLMQNTAETSTYTFFYATVF